MTVRVDAYFHLISPDQFSGQHQIGESSPNTFSSSEAFELDRFTYCPLSSFVAASQHYEECHLIYGPLESILIDQGFPVEYELDEFNTPHTGTTLSHLQLWLCWLRCKIPLGHPVTSSLGNIFWRHSHFSPQTTRTSHPWATTSFLSLTSKQDFCYTTISHSHIQQCLNLATHISLRQIAAKIPSQLYDNFLPSFLWDLQHKRKPFIPCCH